MTFKPRKVSKTKQVVLNAFETHLSSGKAHFFKRYGMQFVGDQRTGSHLTDIDGKQDLINLHCNGGVFNLGHRNPELIATLTEATQHYDIGNHHLISQPRAELAEQLMNTFPDPLNRVMFGVSGGESVDFALKLACGYTNRSGIVSIIGGYHGHTGLSVQTGDAQYQEPFNIHPQNVKQVPFNDFSQISDAITSETAAVIIETVPATLGMPLPERNYLRRVKEICAEKGALLILDEIQTGWGRTGKLWGFEHFDVLPDMVTLGKGMSGGLYPMSATVFTDKLGNYLHEFPFAHISTFGGAELGCEVSKKVLSISSDQNFLNHVNRLAGRFADELSALKQRPLIGFRQLGLMMALETESELAGQLLTKTAYDHGLLLIYANNSPSIVQFLPALNLNEKDIPEIIARLKKALIKANRLLPLLKLKQKLSSQHV